MPWDEHEAQQILAAINDWPGKLGDSAWEDWSGELCRFQARTVREAIRQIRRTQEKNSRPSLGQVLHECDRACGQKHRERHGSGCPWCEGRQLMRVHYWTMRWEELSALDPPLPGSMQRELDRERVLVDRRVARKIGAVCENALVRCGRCRLALAYPTVKQCRETLGEFLFFRSHADAEVFDRCLQQDAPPPIERIDYALAWADH